MHSPCFRQSRKVISIVIWEVLLWVILGSPLSILLSVTGTWHTGRYLKFHNHTLDSFTKKPLTSLKHCMRRFHKHQSFHNVSKLNTNVLALHNVSTIMYTKLGLIITSNICKQISNYLFKVKFLISTLFNYEYKNIVTHVLLRGMPWFLL